jgi:hypothetical protein
MTHSSLRQRLLGATLILSLAGVPAIAAPVCQALDAKARDTRMNNYFPLRGVDGYRGATGLGALGGGYNAEQRKADEKALEDFAARLSPDLTPASVQSDMDNCRLESPFAIYQQRVKRFGANHPYVQQWLAAQRAVLSFCENPGLEAPRLAPGLPTAAQFSDPALMTLQAQDRRYQQASMLFYAEKLKDAEMAFDRIAADRASPLRPFGAYMGAAIRAGSRPNTLAYEDRMEPESHDASARELQAILADPAMASVHRFTASLIGWMSYHHAEPAARQAQIDAALKALQIPDARLMTDPIAYQRYEHAALDMEALLPRYDDSPTLTSALDKAAQTDPLAQWLLFPGAPHEGDGFDFGNWAVAQDDDLQDRFEMWLHGRNEDVALWQHQRWYRQSRGGELKGAVADGIAQVQGCADEQTLALLPSDYYHLVRQTLQSSAWHQKENIGTVFEEVEGLLRDYPFKGTEAWRAAVRDTMQYLTMRGYLARARRLRDMPELAQAMNGSRLPYLLIGLAEDAPRLAQAMRGNRYLTPGLLNGVSIATMWQLAENPAVETDMRALLARTAWTRLYAQGRPIMPAQDRLMRELSPQFVKDWRSKAGDTVDTANVLVLQDVMASPGFNIEIQEFSRFSADGNNDWGRPTLTGPDYINHNDANWWCALWRDRQDGDREAALSHFFGLPNGAVETGWYGRSVRTALAPAIRESFIFKSQSPTEMEALSTVACAPRMLGGRILKWVRDTPAGLTVEGQDEALANLVWSTRYGCVRQGGNGDISGAAYQLLHARFPHSAAAQRTKYWFDCPDYGDGCKVDPLNTPSRQ